MKVVFTKASAFGAVGIAASVGIVVYAAVKTHKDRKAVAEAVKEEKIDEEMIKAIEEVSDPKFSDSDLERHMCTSVLEGYRQKVLKANDLNAMRSAFLEFRMAHKDITQGGKNGIYFRCKRYLDRLDDSAKEKDEDTDVGSLVRLILEVTQTGVTLLS